MGSGSCCCPFSSSTCLAAPLSSSSTCSSTSTSTCLTTSSQACVFPFTYQGVVHNSCTLSGFPDPWCSTQTDGSGTHVTGNYGDCASSCPVEQETTTTSPTCSSPTGLAAILEPGATWGDVLRAIPTDRYSYPHGQCRSVGVAGYLLGGGVNWLGTYNKYGYGAENILSMRVVLADGRVAEVTAEKTEILSPTPSTEVHTDSNNLFFALRGAGSSYGVVTQLKYIVHEVPEAKPAILLAWADNSADLAAIKAAGQASPDYSVTISLEYAQDFWQNALASPIYRILFPPIMRILRRLGQLRDGTDSYPVFLTVTDIRPEAGRTTEVQRAVDHVKSQGVRLVLERDIAHRIFH